MPQPRFRSRTHRRVQTKLPGGNVALHHVERKPASPKCAVCKKVLKGIPRERPYKMQTIARSKKTVERPFGGNLCSECSRKKIKSEARV
ncbi:MAG: 50S ribosomal protein L34e [Nanoarchaeota archaeon]|nr:50S ribosomal protein L34e [Nanoarchaeota archaeon]